MTADRGNFMKIQLSAVLIAALALGGCSPQTDAAKQQAGDQTQTAQATPKKKCADASTGSRLGSCNGMSTDAVQGTNGDDYRDSARLTGMSGANPK